MKPENKGFMLGLLGVISFSLTLPMTRLAVAELPPLFVGLGRSLVAAVCAAALLAWKGERVLPPRRHLRSLFIIGGGVIIGFPLFSALAMKHVSAVHGAVVVALLPLGTAVAAVWRAHEKPSSAFWLAALAGSLTIVGFLLWENGATFSLDDGWLLLAVITCSFGYAEGGRLAREIGGWKVICWALILAAPFLVIPVAWSGFQHGLRASMSAWAGFAYVSVISMFLGFCAWYAGLALGGVARVGQAQLFQSFFTFAASAFLLGETVTPTLVIVAVIVVATVALGRRARVTAAK